MTRQKLGQMIRFVRLESLDTLEVKTYIRASCCYLLPLFAIVHSEA